MRQTILVYGAGMMGSGIAACAAVNGHPVVLIDLTRKQADAGREKALANVQQMVDNGIATKEQGNWAVNLISSDTDYTAYLPDTRLIIEAAFEDVEVKRKIFTMLDETVPEHIIISSNTSGMMLKKFTEQIAHPERTAITHFWFPGHLVPLVEIVMGEHTSEKTAQELKELLLSWNKAPVIVRKDLPGQLANRILQAIIREAVNIVDSGLASADDVDTAIKMGMALRFPAWGPLEHIDAVGLDLALSVQRDVLQEISHERTPSEKLEGLVRDGKLGVKTGTGFYDWSRKDIGKLSQERDACIINTLKLIRSFSDET